MKNKNLKQKTALFDRLPKTTSFLVVGIFIIAAIGMPLARADNFDAQVKTLNQQNVQHRQVVNQLQIEANSYQDAINKLEGQIVILQQQIRDNEAKRDKLKLDIIEAEAELARQKKLLGENIKVMYLEGQLSTIEMLASSRNLSEYVDKEQYRNAVKDKIKATVDRITKLKLQLQEQKNQVDRLLQEQVGLNDQLAANRNQQAQLLSYTEGQKAAFQQQIKDNNSKIAELRRQQVIANARNTIGSRSGDPSNGYYPYANWPFSMRLGPGCVDGDGPDRWGYCTRQCVSYAAWAVERSGRKAPMYYGDAKNWAYVGSRYSVSSPAAGDVAIDTNGTWGHAMYVEDVGQINGRAAIFISQYNAGLDGQYSKEWRYANGLTFLRFP